MRAKIANLGGLGACPQDFGGKIASLRLNLVGLGNYIIVTQHMYMCLSLTKPKPMLLHLANHLYPSSIDDCKSDFRTVRIPKAIPNHNWT